MTSILEQPHAEGEVRGREMSPEDVQAMHAQLEVELSKAEIRSRIARAESALQKTDLSPESRKELEESLNALRSFLAKQFPDKDQSSDRSLSGQ